jgi:hypothetical protein
MKSKYVDVEKKGWPICVRLSGRMMFEEGGKEVGNER